MDERLHLAGDRIAACAHAATCPGLLKGTVNNSPEQGVFPRGLYVRPPDCKLDEIEIVVLGQNPGQGGAFERFAHKAISEGGSETFFPRTNALMLEAMHDIRYWRSIDTLLNALWHSGASRNMLALELVYCQTEAGRLHPGRDTVAYCTNRHLRQQLQLLPDNVFVLCVGASEAGRWFANYENCDRFSWFVIDHITGYRGRSMVDTSGSLTATVRQNWHRVLNGERGVHLTRSSWRP